MLQSLVQTGKNNLTKKLVLVQRDLNVHKVQQFRVDLPQPTYSMCLHTSLTHISLFVTCTMLSTQM